MNTFRVASVQFELRAEKSVSGFLGHVESLVKKAKDGEAELVVFPELASTGLLAAISDHLVTSETIKSDYWHFLAPLTDQIIEGLSQIAKENNIYVLGGSHNRIADDGTLRNTAVLAHPDGSVEMQDKLHLTPPEVDLGAVGGNHVLVTQIGPFKAGVLICADIQFPELSRHLVSKGVELILCPSLTWNRRGVFRVKTGCSARAVENQMFVVMSPLVGNSGLPADGVLYAVGRSLVTAPVDKNFGLNDGMLADETREGEQVLFADLDREQLLTSRENPEAPGIKLQRPELYKRLQEDELVIR
ncbi:MAG: hypothetical protein RIS09_634 [Actinomycetota bacterium]|jgi:predicted amidohydrolase